MNLFKLLWARFCGIFNPNMEEKNNNVFRTIVTLASQVARDSAMSPYLWLCAIICLGSFVGLCFSIFEKSIIGEIIFAIFAFLPIVLFAKAYSYFMRNNPDCLRSEKYLLQKQAIDVFGDQNKDANIEGVASVKNPALKEIAATEIVQK
jgi:hypothetical protein